MTIKDLRNSGYIVYEVISGSRAYGTELPTSDTDIRGVFILPTDEVLSGRYIEQVADDTNDIVFYEIGRFIELLMKGNPNMLELLNVDDKCVIYKSDIFGRYFTNSVKKLFITKQLANTFCGYAFTQIKKAKGLNKMINMEKVKVTRKGVLDFCYVLCENEKSMSFRSWSEKTGNKQDNIGLAKINNFPDLYTMYYMETSGGIVNDKSNDVQLRSIPKESKELGKVRFNKDGYSVHCKDYRNYQSWLKNRNPHRFDENMKGEQGYDKKNMMHCMRLLQTAGDIADGKGIIVRRPNRSYLMNIRMGEMKYDDLIKDATILLDVVKRKFRDSNLPEDVDVAQMQELVLFIRRENYSNSISNTEIYNLLNINI